MTDKEENPPIDTAFELAANPLNSVNPPPKDLPDLLDRLLHNDTNLEGWVKYCYKFESEFTSRLRDLEARLKNLRQKFPQWRSDNPERLEGPKDKHRIAFESQEAVYTRMISQITFLRSHAAHRKPFSLMGRSLACRDIFDAFLGEKHDHRGIEIANSAHLHCVNGCRWYFEHGPYEWTKKPYSNEWWAEMNHTDWDWVKVREHIQGIFEENNECIQEVDEFLKDVLKFIPPWFWRGETHKWSLQTRFSAVHDPKRGKQMRMTVFVSYQKTESEVEQERENMRAALIVVREQRGVEDAKNVDASQIMIEPMATYDFKGKGSGVFDGIGHVADTDLATMVSRGSWLDYWGYSEWFEKYNRSYYQR